MADRFKWLDTVHPIYAAWRDEWLRNERRLRGGGDVLVELRPFMWEEEEGEHYESRQAEATYVNWPDQFATIMTGHLLREAPSYDGGGLDFGTLGSVVRTGRDPSYAELVYFNVDGAGQDGSEWDAWWTAAEKRAMATGHRWIFTEGAPFAPANLDDILYRGARPYLVEFSPLSVPFWHFDHGRLVCAIVRVNLDTPRLSENTERIEGVGKAGYMLLVAEGFDGFGEAFSGGGWWQFSSDRKPLWEGEGADAEAAARRYRGDWTFTRGEIPMVPLFWERDAATDTPPDELTVPGARTRDQVSRPGTRRAARPAISRPALTELGQLAVSEMNLESAADFDAWEAGGSEKYFIGITKEAMNLADEKRAAGSKWIPILANPDGDVPQIHDASSGAVSAEVFQGRITSKREAAAALAALHATSVPDSSGVSKQMGFAEGKSPRLALAAKYLQQAQNAAIRFLEMRFGASAPSGSVTWPKEYDLRNVIEDIRDLFDLESRSGLASPTLGAKLMLTAAREKGMITSDEEARTVTEEYKEAAERKAENAVNAAAAFSQIGSGL